MDFVEISTQTAKSPQAARENSVCRAVVIIASCSDLRVWVDDSIAFQQPRQIPCCTATVRLSQSVSYRPIVSAIPLQQDHSAMIVSVAKLSTICSSSEIALVRSSRKPEMNQLTPVELKRLAVRARKLFDKSLDQGRTQARAKSRVFGSGSVAQRTQLRKQVFSEALKNFEARLAQLDATPAASAVKTKPKTKKVRSAGHRATRAKVRKSLARQK
jgi:hypothetical protein